MAIFPKNAQDPHFKPHRPLRKPKVLHACNYIVNGCLYWKIKPFEPADSQQIWGTNYHEWRTIKRWRKNVNYPKESANKRFSVLLVFAGWLWVSIHTNRHTHKCLLCYLREHTVQFYYIHKHSLSVYLYPISQMRLEHLKCIDSNEIK